MENEIWYKRWTKVVGKWIKRRTILECFIIVILIFCSLMIYKYFKVFDGGYSQESDDWGNFGDYFGSITGLLAFLGVLYTIKISNKQVKSIEDKNNFFRMLDLYQKQADSLLYDEENGVKAFNEYATAINSKLVMYVIYDKIIHINDINSNEPNLTFYKKVAKNYVPELSKININQGHFDQIKEIIRRDIQNQIIKIPSNYNGNILYIALYRDIFEKIDKERQSHYIYNSMRNVADSIYKEKAHYLGQYFRNIHYLMEVTSKSNDKIELSKIFRAQLSRYELLLLLYNSVSSQSSKKTVDFLSDYNIFNNIEPEDIFLYNNKKTISDFIIHLFKEYKNDPKNVK